MTGQKALRIVLADAAVFGLVFALTNVFSYVYLIVAGQVLPASQFGVFNALLGLLTLAGIVATGLQTAVTQVAVVNPTRRAMVAVTRTTARVALPAVALPILVVLPFVDRIGVTVTQMLLCGCVALAMMLAGSSMGYLVGMGKVRLQAGINLVGTILRLGVGWPLMLLQFGVVGAISGYLFHSVVALVLAYVLCSRLAPVQHTNVETPDLRIDGRSIATFVSVFAPFTLDQVLVQSVAPDIGGEYAALATVAKLVFFGAFPIIAVAYPHLLSLSDRRRRLWFAGVALVGVLAVAGVLAVILGIYSDHAMRLFFAGRFGEGAPLLAPMALGLACFSISTLGAHLLIVWGSRFGYLPSLVPFLLGIGLFVMNHDSLAAVVQNQLSIYILQLLLIVIFVGGTIWRRNRECHAALTQAAA